MLLRYVKQKSKDIYLSLKRKSLYMIILLLVKVIEITNNNFYRIVKGWKWTVLRSIIHQLYNNISKLTSYKLCQVKLKSYKW